MNALRRLRVVVAGAGALGSVMALQLVRAGAQVLLADPAPLGANASGVAAGMLAPVFETLLDPAGENHFDILREARDAWPSLEHSLAPAFGLVRSGAVLRVADGAAAEALVAGTLGAHLGLLDAEDARGLAPGLAGGGAWLFTPDDWRLDPRAALAALHGAFTALGGQMTPAAAIGFERGLVRFDHGQELPADRVVLATGHATGAWPDAGDDWLMPIKGQILRFAGVPPQGGVVIRGEGIYIVPDPAGVIVGATMEPGRSDLEVDPRAVRRLQDVASAILPSLAAVSPIVSVGIRAATPDALPLAGPSRQPGVFLARGARRNGWLLAPLVAQVIMDQLLERPSSALAARFDPGRFG